MDDIDRLIESTRTPNDEIADACEAAGYPRTWFREGDKLPTYIELSEQE